MDALLEFMWKSTGVLLLFVIVYELLLKRLTFFNANRWFLIVGLLASIAFPFIEITQTVYIEAPQEVFVSQEIATPMAFVLEQQPLEIAPVEPEPTIDLGLLAIYGYFAVVLFFLGKMTVELASLVKLIRSGAREKSGGFVYVTLSRKLTPFSFFNYICYSAHEKNTAELDLIIDHEKVHARDWHSVDLLLSHLYRAVFWFNPLAWIVKKQIGENLEFIADAVAKRQHSHGVTYERALLSRAASHMQPALANNFFTPFIKQRIVMLQKETSALWNAYKYALILPVMLVFIYSFNRVTEVEYIRPKTSKTQKALTDSKLEILKKQIEAALVYTTTVNGVVENETNIPVNGSVDRIKLQFTVNAQTTNAELSDNAASVSKVMSYQLRFEDIKRDASGAITSLLVATQFADKPWYRNCILKSSPFETYFFYVNNKEIQIQVGQTGKNLFIDADGVQTVDNNYAFENTRGENNANTSYAYSVRSEDKEPLFIIDGAVMKDLKTTDINADTIESITILKDKNAIDEYGDNGINGVVKITTKNGTIGPTVKTTWQFVINATADKATVKSIISKANNASQANIKLSVIKYDDNRIVKIKLVKESRGAKNEITLQSSNGIKPICIQVTADDINIESCLPSKQANDARNTQKLSVRGFTSNRSTGNTSNQSSDYLIIVNGTVYTDDLDEIPTTSIESVNVIKDKAATLLYGDAGKNGVILVTTKNADVLSAAAVSKEKSGYLYASNATFFYVVENDKTVVYNRWGQKLLTLDKIYDGKSALSGNVTIDTVRYSYNIVDNKIVLKDSAGKDVDLKKL